MAPSAMERVETLFERFTAKDVEGVVGHDAIRQGIAMGLGMLERPGSSIRHRLSADGDAGPFAVEVDANHELAGGAVAAFPQVFVVELEADGLFRRVQSYTPYPPPSVP